VRRLALALLLVAAAGCRRFAPPPEPRLPTPGEIHAAAVVPATVRFTMRTTVEAPGGGVASASTTTGRADLAKQVAVASVVFDPDSNVYSVPGHDVARTVDRVYLRTTGAWVWFPLPANEAERGPAMSPMLPFDLLTSATRDWHAVGEETMDGVLLRHLRGEGDRLTVDAWITGESRPVRIDAVVRTVVPMTMRLDLRDYGASDVDVRAPGTARRVADVEAAFEAVGLR
jgi:hypothetical protein